ncbi:MAG: M16 family metallopeptidase [Flavobacteriales bacterium]
MSRFLNLNLFLTVILISLLAGCNSGNNNSSSKYTTKTKKDKNGNEYKYVTNDEYNARIYQLKNGLKVYMAKDEEEPRVSTRIAVRAGSASEQRETTGLAHYLEHMLFKGSNKMGTLNWEKEKPLLKEISSLYEKRRKTKDSAKRRELYKKIDSLSQVAAKYAIPNEYDKMVSGLGGQRTNAYTSKDQTVYVNNIPTSELKKWIKIERERFRKMVLRLFHTELETVFEEFNRTQDNDFRKVRYVMNKAIYKGHPYKLSTIGKPEHLKNPSMKNVHEFKNTYYVPNNMAICLSGDLNPAETFKWIKKEWGDMEKGKDVPENRNYGKAKPINKVIEKEVQGPEAERVYFGYRFPADDSIQQMVDLISSLLYNGDAGLIDLSLVKKQKVLNAASYFSFYNDYGVLQFYGQARSDQTLEQVKDLLKKQVEKIKKGNFSNKLLKAVIRNKKKSRIQSRSSNYGKVSTLSSAFIRHQPWKKKVQYLDNLKEISKEDIVKFAKEHFKNNYVLVYKRHGEDTSSVNISKPPITKVDINRNKKSSFRKKIENMESKRLDPVFVDYKKRINNHKTPAGPDLKYIKKKENKLFDLNYVVEIGNDHDKKLALAVEYLDKLGTNKYTSEELERKFYELGIDFRVNSSDDRSYVSISGLPESMPEGVKLLEHLLKNAEPDSDAYKKMIDNKIEQRRNNLKSKFMNMMALRIYGTYGKNSDFTDKFSEEELRSFKPENLVKKLQDLYDHNHYIFYHGQQNPKKVGKIVSKHHKVPDKFQELPEKKTYTQRKPTGDSVFFVNYDMVQANVSMVSRGTKQNKELFPYAKVFNTYYGSGLSSVVFQEIREAKGLAYSARAYYNSPYTGKYHFASANIGTQADKAFETIDAMMKLLREMKGSKEQFKIAKENILKEIETNRITGSSIFWNYQRIKEEGFEKSKRKMIYNKVKDLTYKDMKKFFNDHIKNGKYDLLVMGKKEHIDMTRLKEYGSIKKVPVKDLFGYDVEEVKAVTP